MGKRCHGGAIAKFPQGLVGQYKLDGNAVTAWKENDVCACDGEALAPMIKRRECSEESGGFATNPK
jgi:hypothetical protein